MLRNHDNLEYKRFLTSCTSIEATISCQQNYE